MVKYNWDTKIIEELCEKYGLSKRLITSITHSQFEMIKKKVTVEQKNIILPYLGKFAIKEGRRKYWEDYDAKKLQEQENENKRNIQSIQESDSN